MGDSLDGGEGTVATRPERRPRDQDRRGAARCRPIFPFGIGTKAVNRSFVSVRTLPYLTTPVSPFHAEPLHRDGKTGCPIIVYGALTDADGRPVAVQGDPGNTGDPTTVPDRVEALTKRFGLSRVVLVGDRGMLTQTPIDRLKKHPGLGWISAWRSGAIRRLGADGHLIRKDLEAERLAAITAPEFPGERLVACYNPQLAEQRRHKRQELLAATEAELEALAARVARPTGPPETAAAIGVRAGQVINHYTMAKHFTMTMRDGHLGWSRKREAIDQEELLDGIYPPFLTILFRG